ncbi:hypothetical protein QM276_18500, partial [Acinetobacter baumannii]|nr:hypothetical protein [Acinetobacter baumannii]
MKGQKPIPISLVTIRETVHGPASPITDKDFLKGELSMSIRPLHDRVNVKRKEVESKSAGGIV